MRVEEAHYRILSTLQVTRAGEVLNVGGKAQRTLLAALLLRANEPVSVDELAEAVWGEDAPSSPSRNIQVHLSNLRKLLGPHAIEHTPGGYVIHVTPDRLDLTRFEDLAERGRAELAAGHAAIAVDLLDEGLALWHGEPLTEFAFEPFAQAAIARLEELRLAAITTRAQALLRLRRPESVIPELTELVAQRPHDEQLHGLLMLALYAAGRQSEALAVYRTIRGRLKDGLGLDPSPFLREIERGILKHDVSLEPEPQRLRSVVVAPTSLEELEPLATLAAPLAGARHPHELILVCLAGVNGTTTADDALDGAVTAARAQQLRLSASGATIRTAVFTTTDRPRDLLHLTSRAEVDLVLCGTWADDVTEASFGPGLLPILEQATCDVAFTTGTAPPRADEPAILVPFGGREHDWAAAEVGAWLASRDHRPLVLLGTRGGSEGRDASRMLADAGLLLQRLTGVTVEPRLIPPGRRGLLEAVTEEGLLVMGLSDRWATEGLGDARWEISRRLRRGVVFVRRGLRPSGVSPASEATRYRWSRTLPPR